MKKRALAWAVLLVALACGDERPPVATEVGRETTSAAVRDRPTEVEMVAAMEAHYSVVILAHDALLQGNLQEFRSQLALVPDQELPPTSPASWLPLHERLQVAASEAQEVSDLDGAAGVLARVVLACGTCHAALETGPVYPAPAPDDGRNVLETAMLDHQWATERLWEGVTGPWPNAWERGAAALARVQSFDDAGLGPDLAAELLRREQELRAIGEEARTTTQLSERAALYGRLLTTCGECHQLIGVTFEAPD